MSSPHSQFQGGSIPHLPSAAGIERKTSTLPSSSTAGNLTNVSNQPSTSQDAKVAGLPPAHAQRPYQIQPLADLRSGSLPPADSQDDQKKGRRGPEDAGTRTEPESATEDTTDYSSSDQYERKHAPEAATSLPYQYNVLLSNPLTLQDLPSYFQTTPTFNMPSMPTTTLQRPQPLSAIYQRPTHQTSLDEPPVTEERLAHAHSSAQQQTTTTGRTGSPVRQQSPKRTLRRFSLQNQRLYDEDQQQPGGSDTPPKGKRGSGPKGVFEHKEFSRMSFNTRLNRNVAQDKGEKEKEVEPSATEEKEGIASTSKLNERRRSRQEEERGSRRRSTTAHVSPVTARNTSAAAPRNPFELSPSTSRFGTIGAVTDKPRRSVAAGVGLFQRAPASSSLATAMYPPVKRLPNVSPKKVGPTFVCITYYYIL
jgi:hypothetical protein